MHPVQRVSSLFFQLQGKPGEPGLDVSMETIIVICRNVNNSHVKTMKLLDIGKNI